MTDKDILTMLKTDLQISATQYDAYLTNLIKLAKAAIEREGIVLNVQAVSGGDETGESETGLTIEDGMLVQMYAAYLYRKRKEENTAMPRSLRYALNNRLFSQKGSAT